AWIKLYRPDENTVNTTVSYYLKGAVATLLLDLEIRRRSQGERSLDDALRLLWTRFLQGGRGYEDGAIQPLAEEATGLDLAALFAGDEIVAWDGFRVDENAVKDRLSSARPGDAIRLHVFRRDELRELLVTLGKRPADKIEVVPLEDAPDSARAAYERWMLEPWK